jgi:hypothetical protein
MVMPTRPCGAATVKVQVEASELAVSVVGLKAR